MAGENGYGEEGYTVMGMDHYTIEEGHSRVWGVLSFFLGGVVGAGIALLLTPQTGSRTRQQIREASLEAKDKARVRYSQVREKMGDVLTRGKDLVSESRPLVAAAIEAGKTAYEKEKKERRNDKTHAV
jgi:gas vesicle protein